MPSHRQMESIQHLNKATRFQAKIQKVQKVHQYLNLASHRRIKKSEYDSVKREMEQNSLTTRSVQLAEERENSGEKESIFDNKNIVLFHKLIKKAKSGHKGSSRRNLHAYENQEETLERTLSSEQATKMTHH